ncbi:MAG TPA: APC family permease [Candidatus Dormibacteraeota bacterium]|nr:APC family permease [Candidatus Dormibacteraeota bacterium]
MSHTDETDQGPREVKLKRALTLWHLVIYGIIIIQPTAPMPIFGVVAAEARGHVVTAVLIAMVAMLFTAISYGRMARAYPSAGSAYTYVGHEIHPALGYATGWSMLMDYILNPLICTIWCSKAAGNIAPEIPYTAWAIFFAALFTILNLRGIQTTARINDVLAAAMGVVILLFLIQAGRYIFGMPSRPPGFFTRPFYDPATFSSSALFTGTSIAVLTYIGFDGISTLSEEVENPRRNILLATVLVCLITGVLASVEVYAAQLVWPAKTPFPDIDTAYAYVAGRAGGQFLFQLVNFTLLVANIGSGMGAQLGAARLLYGMGRDHAIPNSFFGRLDPKRRIPRNGVIFVGAIALAGALLVAVSIHGHALFSYQLGAELLNFGAFIAFMGVNAASLLHYYWRADSKQLKHLIPAVLGFAICLFLWVHLRWQAKLAGGVWMLVGILYGCIKTRGFSKMASCDVPTE